MPDDAVATIRQLEILHGGERLGLHLDSLREKLSGTRTQDTGQGIIDLVGLTKSNNTAILFHGVSLSLRGSGRLDTRLDTPPISHRHHPVSRLAPCCPALADEGYDLKRIALAADQSPGRNRVFGWLKQCHRRAFLCYLRHGAT